MYTIKDKGLIIRYALFNKAFSKNRGNISILSMFCYKFLVIFMFVGHRRQAEWFLFPVDSDINTAKQVSVATESDIDIAK